MFDDLVLSMMMPYVPVCDIVAVSIAFWVSIEDGGYNPLRHDAINAIQHHLTVGNIHASAAIAISSPSVAVISLVMSIPSIFFLVEGNACFNLSNVDDFWGFIIQHYRTRHMADSPEMYHYLVGNGLWISKVHRHVYATYGVDEYERYHAADDVEVNYNDWAEFVHPRKGREMSYSRGKLREMATKISRKTAIEMYNRHQTQSHLSIATYVYGDDEDVTQKMVADGLSLSQSALDSSHP